MKKLALLATTILSASLVTAHADIVSSVGLTTEIAHSVVGLDPSIGMLLAGREKATIANVQGTSERLPFRDRSFDLITIGFALRHFADLDRVFDRYSA